MGDGERHCGGVDWLRLIKVKSFFLDRTMGAEWRIIDFFYCSWITIRDHVRFVSSAMHPIGFMLVASRIGVNRGDFISHNWIVVDRSLVTIQLIQTAVEEVIAGRKTGCCL